jgi:hypothetical protein
MIELTDLQAKHQEYQANYLAETKDKRRNENAKAISIGLVIGMVGIYFHLTQYFFPLWCIQTVGFLTYNLLRKHEA